MNLTPLEAIENNGYEIETREAAMREIGRDGDEVQLSVSTRELRTVLGALNEALNGAYAIPEDEWAGLVGTSPEAADVLIRSLVEILER